LDSLAPVIDPRAVTQKRRNVFGIVLSALISRAGKLDPVSRSVDARSSAREYRRQLRMYDPTACTDCRCVRAVLDEHHRNRDVLVRHRHAERAVVIEPIDEHPYGGKATDARQEIAADERTMSLRAS
jgi:hypothetical protein